MVDGKFPAHFGEVIELEEENYFFRMSDHQKWLMDYINQHPDWIRPPNRRNEVLGTLQRPLDDLCISRPRARLSWGIPLPFDADYVTYVWFDALVNYISIPGYGSGRFNEFWPADFHLIAKDILTPHAIYWPTMLHALGVEMPRCILAHGWWLFKQEKMSKSLGNAVNPLDLISRFGADALRYFICRELQMANDTDFSEERFLQRFNADLANDLGNLINRSLSMIHRYRKGVVPSGLPDKDIHHAAVETIRQYQAKMRQVEYGPALEAVWKLISKANRYIDETAPWKLAKDESAKSRLDTVLKTLVETVNTLAVLVAPVMPETAAKIHTQLNITNPSPLNPFNAVPDGHAIGLPAPLFPRHDPP